MDQEGEGKRKACWAPQVACGHNHTVAVDSDGMGYTWGNGGYGRLGQKVQKDEFAPKRLEHLTNHVKAQPDGVVRGLGPLQGCR